MPKINELTAATALTATDVLAMDNTSGTATRKVTGQQIKDFATADVNAEVADLKNALNYNKTATPGYILRATDEGTGQEWAQVGTPTDAQTADAVSNWLNAHPEATTTVQDDSLTETKLVPVLRERINATAIRNRLNVKFLGRTIHSAPYTSAQGFLAREENGTLYIYTCYYNYNTSDEKSIIEKMDTSGNIIKTSDPLAMNHSNDMCTDGEYLYVCGYNHDKLYKIDPSSLEIVETIQLQYAIQSITYDYDRGLFYGYSSLSQYRIFAWTPDFSAPEIVGTYTINYGVETVEYYDGFVLFNENAPNSLTAVSVETWEPVTVSTFNEFMSDYYPIGEMQGVSIYNANGDFITVGKPRQKSTITNSDEIGYGITAFGIGNINNDTTFTKRYESASVIDYKAAASINSNLLVFCPIGTTAAPFYNAGDLIVCLDSPYFNPKQITLLSDVADEFAVYQKEIYIEGGNHTIARAGIEMCSGLLSNVIITAGTILNSRFTLRNVSGGISYTLCSLDLISGESPVSSTSTVLRAQGINGQRIVQVTSGSSTYAFSGVRPLMLLFCILDGTTTYQETMIIPFGAMGGAKLESESYTAEMNSAQTTLTVTKTSEDATVRVRAYAIY